MRTHRPCGVPLTMFCLVLMCLALERLGAADTIEWKNIGPGSGGNMFMSAVNPADPRIILMGSDVGGIYRSSDGGQTWSLRNNALVDPTRFGNYSMIASPTTGGTFAFDPTNSNTVYAGSLKSVDAGWTWTEKVPAHINGRVTAIDPNQPGTVYVAGYGNVYRTTNGFTNGDYARGTGCWSSNYHDCQTNPMLCDCPTSCIPEPGGNMSCPKTDVIIHSLVVDPDPGSPGHLLACVGPNPPLPPDVPCDADHCGLWESTNAGSTWTKITPTVSPAGALPQNFECNRLALHAPTRTLYMTVKTAWTVDDTGHWPMVDSWKGGVFRSVSPSFGHAWESFNGEASEQPNIFSNSGFEIPTQCDPTFPTGWAPWSVANRVSTTDRSGNGTCAIITGTGPGPNPNPEGGVFSACVPMQSGKVYEVAVWARPQNYDSCASPNLTVQGQFTLFSDANCASPLNFPGYCTPLLNTFGFVHPMTGTVNNGWRKYMTLLKPPTDQTVYAKLLVNAQTTPGCAGQTMFDDLTLRQVDSLAKVGGNGNSSGIVFVNYDAIVVDPYDVNTVYVGTTDATSSDYQLADTAGVWKSSYTGGVLHWNLSTLSSYKDNVQDGISTAPRCGNGTCEGRWEKCDTCPADCTGVLSAPWACSGVQVHPPAACCGDGVCDASGGETVDNCRVDCPAYTVAGRSYNEYESPGYRIWTLAIGKDQPSGVPPGNQTLAFGSEPTITTNGGALWTQVSSDHAAPPAAPYPSWKARGDATDTITLSVVTDPTDPNRLYYGDTDNGMQFSFDGGQHFSQEGQAQWVNIDVGGGATISGDAATSIVLDDANPNVLYVGVACGEAAESAPGCAGLMKGTFHPATAPAVGKWTWERLGDQSAINKKASVELIHTKGVIAPPAMFIAAIYGQGIFRLGSNDVWSNSGVAWDLPLIGHPCTGQQEPCGKDVYRLIQEPGTERLYLGVGDPYYPGGLPALTDETGVYEGTPDGSHWCKISDPVLMDQEPILTLVTNGPNTLFAGTFTGSHLSTGGGIYRGTRQGACSWTWERVLAEPMVSGLAVSPAHNSILYAHAAQVCCAADTPGQEAGIYKSTQGGAAGTWTLLTDSGLNNPNGGGLMNLLHGRLTFDSLDPHLLYASSRGSGVFQGTITCGPPIEGFTDTDQDGTADCADTCTDTDGDSFGNPGYPANTCTLDNCPTVSNPEQQNFDGDSQGDACDTCTDTDGDGFGNPGYPANTCTLDNCPTVSNPGQQNFDGDSQGDACDTDDDNDGDPDVTDCAPLNPAIGHTTTEGISSLSGCFDNIDNDCNGFVDIDCAANVVAGSQIVGPGSVTQGSESDLSATSTNNSYEVITETLQGSSRQLKAIWSLRPATSALPGTNYDLLVEGFRYTSGDSYNFSFSQHAGSSNCTSSEGGTTPIILSVLKIGDDDQTQVADLTLPQGTYCVKVVDSKPSGDTTQDTFKLDRVFIFPTPVALADQAASGDVGTITATFAATQLSDDSRQSLREEQSGNIYRLWHTWRFDKVPGGTGHKLHLEGYRSVGTGGKLDDFQFYWSTNPASWSPTNPTTGFTLISGAVISSTGDVALDSSSFGGASLSGTVYIRVIDAQKPQTSNWQNTLNLDHLVIKTLP